MPRVGGAFLPAVQARLVDPLVVLASEDERVLLPHETLADHEPDVVARAAEVVSFAVRVPDVERRTGGHVVLRALERALEEVAEGGVLHRVVHDRHPGAAFVGDVVRRVREPERGEVFAHQLRDVGLLRGVAAEESVRAEPVHFARTALGDLGRGRRVVRVGFARGHGIVAAHQFLEFVRVEAEGSHVGAVLLDREEFVAEELQVPFGQLGALVVRDPVGARLLGREVRRDDHRSRVEAEALRREEARVAGDDDVVLVDDDGVDEPVGLDRLHEEVDGALVDARVLLVGVDVLELEVLDFHGGVWLVKRIEKCAAKSHRDTLQIA